MERYFLLLYGQLRKRAIWTNSGTVIGFLSRQDDQSGLPTETHLVNPLLTKLVQSRWLDIGLVPFLRVYGPRLCLYSIFLYSIFYFYHKIQVILKKQGDHTKANTSGEEAQKETMGLIDVLGSLRVKKS